MSHTVTLTEGPIAKNLIRFSVPILLSNLFQQLYNAIDTMVVGRFSGESALAAVGSTGALINLLIGFFLGIATGTGILYAMHYGAGDKQGLKKLIDSAMLLSVIAAALISILGIVFSTPLLRWMETPEDVLPEAKQYLNILLGGTVVVMIYNVGAGMIRAEGDSTRPLIYLLIGGAGNLILDLVLVAGFGMGVVGAGIATVATQAIACVLTVIRLTKLDSAYALRPLHIRPDKVETWDIIRVSVPCGLQGSMFNIANLLVQAKINTFGTLAMAGVAAYTKIDGFVYMPENALGFAISTYVGQNIGAGHYDRIRKGVRAALVMTLICVGGMGCAVFFSCKGLLRFFTTDQGAQAYSIQMMHFLAPLAWTYAFSEILGGAVRGAGHPMKMTIISALCICAYRILWLTIMLRFINDIRVIFICYPISWILSGIVVTIYYFKGSAMRESLRHS